MAKKRAPSKKWRTKEDFSKTKTFKKKPPARSPRFQAIYSAMEAEFIARFPNGEAITAFGTEGWSVKRPVHIEKWVGTMDPNFFRLLMVERKQGVVLYFWSPYDYGGLKKRQKELTAAGFKVMVGCLQYNRKGEYPVHAVTPLLDSVRAAMDAES